MPSHRTPRNLVDQRFGRLIVLRLDKPFRDGHQSVWLCRCDCGNEISVVRGSLTTGNTRSCGCLRKEVCAVRATRHACRNTPEYEIWQTMISRCYNKNNRVYKWYGGRGIGVHEPWRMSFARFLEDVGKRPDDSLTLDRIRNDGNYEPGNVRWADRRTQSRNTRKNVLLTFNGKTQALCDWAEETRINSGILRYRLRQGWSIEKTLTTPARRAGKKSDAL